MSALFHWLTVDHVWVMVGLLGQALFMSRFILQWFKSEMVGKSVIPVSFWYCSIGGGVVLLAYSIYRLDPVYILGQAGGLVVYARNLFLIFRERNEAARQSEPAAG
jgi:lipid-A-disaccharide synthase-like uncharacterized protein